MPRRRRTPASIEYRPLPLYLALPATPLDLPGIGPIAAGAELTIFDFAAVSLACAPANLHFFDAQGRRVDPEG